MARAASLFCLLAVATGQQAGPQNPEVHPKVSFSTCTKAGGCTTSQKPVTMDAQWRWLHDAREGKFGDCIDGSPPEWHSELCPNGRTCAENCAIEGMDGAEYKGTYGVKTVPNGVQLQFKTGESIGSRLYMMEDDDHYMMYKLLNREFTFDVDVSTLECGLNGALYFVEMKADGGKYEGNNAAGAMYGTGYCDAQCPHDLKFIRGEANMEDWHETPSRPIGKYGNCCAEMDIWEANFAATSYTTHACDAPGPLRCEGLDGDNTCGDTPSSCTCCLEPDCTCCGRYSGNCDKDGCDFNPFRLGEEKFYGKGSEFTVDTSKPMTVVTQFLTSDGTDTGDLIEIRRLYVQDGKVINNAKGKHTPVGVEGSQLPDSITDEMCQVQKLIFKDRDDFTKKGSLKGMGKALGRGMVLVLSLWDDLLTKMQWLDAAAPADQPDTHPLSQPGVRRGPCPVDSGDPLDLRQNHADAYVKFTNIRVGEIDSTYGEHWDGGSGSDADNGGDDSGDDDSGGDDSGDDDSGGGGGGAAPECCTASIGNGHPCDFCWRGAVQPPGHYCAQSEGRCTGDCSGTWCENGATKHDTHPTRLYKDAAPPAAARWKPSAVAAVGPLLAVPGLLAALAWRAGRRRSRSGAAGTAPYGQLPQPGPEA